MLGEFLELTDHDGAHLVNVAGGAARVEPEGAGTGVGGVEGVGGVGQAPLLTHLLEQARGHAPTQDGGEHAHGPAPLIAHGDALAGQVQVALLALARDGDVVDIQGREGLDLEAALTRGGVG